MRFINNNASHVADRLLSTTREAYLINITTKLT
ncbi:MAG: hypothetical protein K0Q49_1645 [Haloplasmataceae bacterium]|jgi:hypothetical protein|nr:hypothetical protein [Haloplasmataceae bacterium]